VLQSLDDLLRSVVFIEVSSAIAEQASQLEPAELRTLDAIHLASALSAADPSIDVITYDERLAEAARAHGLTVVQPGR
jgi:predicted nucleic acid-binding protein